jgi:hypothetical protein
VEEVEKEFLRMAETELERFDRKLSAVGLGTDKPELLKWEDEVTGYSSEIRVYVRKKKQVHDVLEFFIFRSGRQLMTMQAARNWLSQQLEQLSASGES